MPVKNMIDITHRMSEEREMAVDIGADIVFAKRVIADGYNQGKVLAAKKALFLVEPKHSDIMPLLVFPETLRTDSR